MIQASASGQVYVIREIDGLNYVLLSVANNNVKNIEQELAKVKAENEKYFKALKSISLNTCCKSCQEAKIVAREALGILKIKNVKIKCE